MTLTLSLSLVSTSLVLSVPEGYIVALQPDGTIIRQPDGSPVFIPIP